MEEREFLPEIEDLNPTFLFTWKGTRHQSEERYHSHDYLEMAFVMSGSGKYHIDDVIYDVKEGDFLIFNPGVKHQALMDESSEVPTTEFFVGCTDFQLKGFEKNVMPLGDGGHILHTTGDLRQKLFKICSSMDAEKELGGYARYFVMKAYLMQMLVYIIRSQRPKPVTVPGGYSFDPVNKTFTDQEDLSQLWDDESFFLKKISQPKMNFAFYKHNATLLDHSIYRFIFDVGKKVDPGTVEFFLKRIIEITHPCFCFATSDTHWDARCRVKYVHVQGTKEHHINFNDKRLCGVFWRTYFSNDLIKECKWQEKINNLPCECDSLPEGFLLKIYGDCFSPDWEKEDAVINHLGREYIADIKTFYKENNLIPVEEKV